MDTKPVVDLAPIRTQLTAIREAQRLLTASLAQLDSQAHAAFASGDYEQFRQLNLERINQNALYHKLGDQLDELTKDIALWPEDLVLSGEQAQALATCLKQYRDQLVWPEDEAERGHLHAALILLGVDRQYELKLRGGSGQRSPPLFLPVGT